MAQGAEALLIRKGDFVLKRRLRKSYRWPELDEKLRKTRTRKEIKLLEKASEFISVPRIKDFSQESCEITLEYIAGKKLADHFSALPTPLAICKQIGQNIAKLHDHGIIHGDLTTSNMIFFKGRVFFLDFGLGFFSVKEEDKAVDLHVLQEALKAKHYEHAQEYWRNILEGYSLSKNAKAVIQRLEVIERRGRYKQVD